MTDTTDTCTNRSKAAIEAGTIRVPIQQIIYTDNRGVLHLPLRGRYASILIDDVEHIIVRQQNGAMELHVHEGAEGWEPESIHVPLDGHKFKIGASYWIIDTRLRTFSVC